MRNYNTSRAVDVYVDVDIDNLNMRLTFLVFISTMTMYVCDTRFVMSKKLQRASQFTFGELNLRQFFFDKWRHFKNISMATETVDVALLVWGMRDAIKEWKSLAWPRKYKSRRNLRVFKKNRFGRTTTTTLMEGEEESEYIEKKNEYLWPQQEKHGVAVTTSPFTGMNDNSFSQEDDEDEEDQEEGGEYTGNPTNDYNGNERDEPPYVEQPQSQAQWQMAAFGAAGGDGGGQDGSECGSDPVHVVHTGGESVSSKKSWFSTLLSKR